MEVPTYDYECTRCGDTFSVEQSMLDKPLAKCKKCGGKLEKLLPRQINLIFKGSGFYVTDYKRSEAGHGKEGKSDRQPETGKTKPEDAKI
jgi:putative FmdB family regulatory protein